MKMMINLILSPQQRGVITRRKRGLIYKKRAGLPTTSDGDGSDIAAEENVLWCKEPEILLSHVLHRSEEGRGTIVTIGPDWSEEDECLLLRPQSYYRKIMEKPRHVEDIQYEVGEED